MGARREVTWCVRALPLPLIAHYSFFKYWLLRSHAMRLANLLVSVRSRVPLHYLIRSWYLLPTTIHIVMLLLMQEICLVYP